MTSKSYRPITALGTIRIPVETPEQFRLTPVYALLLCPLTAELLAVTEAQQEAPPPEPHRFVVTHWRSGQAIDTQFTHGTPAGAAMDAVHYLLERYKDGVPLYQRFRWPAELNPIPDQIDKLWFVGFQKIDHWWEADK